MNDFNWSIVFLFYIAALVCLTRYFYVHNIMWSLKYFIKYHPHFIGDETKAQKSKRILSKSLTRMCRWICRLLSPYVFPVLRTSLLTQPLNLHHPIWESLVTWLWGTWKLSSPNWYLPWGTEYTPYFKDLIWKKMNGWHFANILCWSHVKIIIFWIE